MEISWSTWRICCSSSPTGRSRIRSTFRTIQSDERFGGARATKSPGDFPIGGAGVPAVLESDAASRSSWPSKTMASRERSVVFVKCVASEGTVPLDRNSLVRTLPCPTITCPPESAPTATGSSHGERSGSETGSALSSARRSARRPELSGQLCDSGDALPFAAVSASLNPNRMELRRRSSAEWHPRRT